MPHLQHFEIFPLRDLNFIPNYFHSFFCVHSQVCSINPWDVTLIHLHLKGRAAHEVRCFTTKMKQISKTPSSSFVFSSSFFILSSILFSSMPHFIVYLNDPPLPLLYVSASGHKGSLPEYMIHLHFRPHPLSLR